MKPEIIELFSDIAKFALISGHEISLEQKEYFKDANGFAGLGGGHTEDTGVILRVWQPKKEEESSEEDEEEED